MYPLYVLCTSIRASVVVVEALWASSLDQTTTSNHRIAPKHQFWTLRTPPNTPGTLAFRVTPPPHTHANLTYSCGLYALHTRDVFLNRSVTNVAVLVQVPLLPIRGSPHGVHSRLALLRHLLPGMYSLCSFDWLNTGVILLHFTGPPVPKTARVHSTPQLSIPAGRPLLYTSKRLLVVTNQVTCPRVAIRLVEMSTCCY
eukprot:8578270-Pyramimonas_sp.AAC.1